jgi:lipoyl(octanoyl) transferase
LHIQNYLHKRAIRENNEYTLFASHYPIFTKGLNEKEFKFALKVDRGGSITYFDKGSFMIYLIYKVTNPPFL